MKIPKARKMTSGKWYIYLRLGDKAYSITEENKTICERKAMLIKSEYLNGKKHEQENKMTVGEAVDAFIADRENVLSPSTIRAYRSYKKNHFKTFQNLMCSDFPAQRAVNEEFTVCSAKTLKNAFTLFKTAIEYQGFKVDKVVLPQIVSEEHPFLEPEQIKPFLSAIKDTDIELVCLLALHSLRRSEILYLRKKHVRNGYIVVQGATVKGTDGWIDKEETKTSKSRRRIPIMIPRLNEVIKDYKPDDRLVQCDPETLRKHLDAICYENGFPPIKIHGLRHTFASLCYSQDVGISEALCMRLGGWSNINVMRNIYTHLAEKDAEEGIEKLRSFFS